MVYAGFDIGNYASCVSLWRKGVVEVAMNAHSKRETRSTVSYGKKRSVGTTQSSNTAAVIAGAKRLIGQLFDESDPLLRKEILRCTFPSNVCAAASGYCEFRVPGQRPLAPEQVIATLVKDLKKSAEQGGQSIQSTVLSVPAFFREPERSAMLTAAELAGLTDVHLVHDLTAAALNWAMENIEFLRHHLHPVSVAFVDVGHSSTQVCSRNH